MRTPRLLHPQSPHFFKKTGCTHGMCKFWGQESNPTHAATATCGNQGSLSCCATWTPPRFQTGLETFAKGIHKEGPLLLTHLSRLFTWQSSGRKHPPSTCLLLLVSPPPYIRRKGRMDRYTDRQKQGWMERHNQHRRLRQPISQRGAKTTSRPT